LTEAFGAYLKRTGFAGGIMNTTVFATKKHQITGVFARAITRFNQIKVPENAIESIEQEIKNHNPDQEEQIWSMWNELRKRTRV